MKQISPAIIISYLVVYIVWGSTYYFIRLAVETIPPFYLVGTRFFIGGIAFLAIAAASGHLKPFPTFRQMLTALFLGTFLLLMGNGLVSIAEKTVDSYLAALTISTTPFAVALLNWLFFREKLSHTRLLGMLFGVAGVALVLYNGTNILGAFTPGIWMVIAGLFCWSFPTSISHKLNVYPNNLVNSGMQMLFAGGIALVISHFFYPPLGPILPLISVRSWVGVAYLTMFGGVAFYCFSYLVKNEPSIRVVSYSIVNPLIAVVLGLLVEKEKAGPFLVFGFPLILVGLVFMLYGSVIVMVIKQRLHR